MSPQTIKKVLTKLTNKPTAVRCQKEGYPDFYFYDSETGALRFHEPDKKPCYGLSNIKSDKGDCVIYDEHGKATMYGHKGTVYDYKGRDADRHRTSWVEGVLSHVFV